MNNLSKKILAVVLTIAMVISLVPATVFAEGAVNSSKAGDQAKAVNPPKEEAKTSANIKESGSVFDMLGLILGEDFVPAKPGVPGYKFPFVNAHGSIQSVGRPTYGGRVETVINHQLIMEALNKFLSGKGKKPVVEIKVDEEEDNDKDNDNKDKKPTKVVDVTVPSQSIEELANTKDGSLKVSTSVGDLEFDNKALNTVASQAGGKDVVITAENKDVSKMANQAQKAAIENLCKKDHVYELTVKVDGREVHQFGGKVKFEFTYQLKPGELAKNIRVCYIDDQGKTHRVDSKYDKASNKITATTDHFSIFAVYYVDAPSKVKVLKAKNQNGKAYLKWSRALNGSEGYRVYRAKSYKGKYKPIAWVNGGNSKSYKEATKRKNGTYYYKVRAYSRTNGEIVWGSYSPVRKVKF